MRSPDRKALIVLRRQRGDSKRGRGGTGRDRKRRKEIVERGGCLPLSLHIFCVGDKGSFAEMESDFRFQLNHLYHLSRPQCHPWASSDNTK